MSAAAGERRTCTTRRSSVLRTRSTIPCATIRSTRRLIADDETRNLPASSDIVPGPRSERSIDNWICAGDGRPRMAVAGRISQERRTASAMWYCRCAVIARSRVANTFKSSTTKS
jgi:hypothetical protein